MNLKDQITGMITRSMYEEDLFSEDIVRRGGEPCSSYENWSFTDVIVHNSEWRNIASVKLLKIMRNEEVQFREENYELLNKGIYDRYSGVNADEARTMSRQSIDLIKDCIEQLGEAKIQENGRLLGFTGPLWRYIVLYGFMHPVKHMVFHYIKRQDLMEAFKMLEANYLLMARSSQLMEMEQGFFNYSYLFSEVADKYGVLADIKRFLSNNQSDGSDGNSIINRFIAGSGL